MDIGQRTCCRPGASTIYSGMSIIGWTYLQSKPVWIKGTSHPYQISKRFVSDGSRGPARIALLISLLRDAVRDRILQVPLGRTDVDRACPASPKPEKT